MQKLIIIISVLISFSTLANDCSDNIETYCKAFKTNYEIQSCLRKNDNKLSSECKSFLSTEIDQNLKLCSLDLIRFCKNTFNKKNNNLENRIECLKENKSKISKKCLTMLKKNSIL